MKQFQIKSRVDKKILFEGKFESFKTCLEAAVGERAYLANANLKNSNLSNAMLDDALMPCADFTGANLTGANLSEALLHGSVFSNAALYNVCFAWSDLQKCNFGNAFFGATDITGCDISFSSFSALSCFTLDFSDTRRMTGCMFNSSAGQNSVFSRPPVVIRGLGSLPLVLMEQSVSNGHEPMHYQDFLALLKSHFAKNPGRHVA